MNGTNLVEINDDWLSAHAPVVAAAGAFQLTPASKDAALVTALRAGADTAPISMTGKTAGVALLEFYDTASGSAGGGLSSSTRPRVRGSGPAKRF